MRLVYAGTPEFAARALDALIRAGHDIPLVLTQPDRPAGRGMKPRMSPVKELALRHGLEVGQPVSLKSEAERDPIRRVRPEIMVVAAYGLILPQAVLDIPPRGCVNIHASLLPRWRGAAPIQRALEAGDGETGITLMRMEAGLDTGPMYARHPLPIRADDSAGSLHDRLADLGAHAIVELLNEMAAREPLATPQDDAQATYARKIGKEEARIDWRRSAGEIDRAIRAFNPFPGAHALYRETPLKIWRAQPVEGSGPPGEVLARGPEGLRVACGTDALNILEMQLAGGKRLPVSAFLAGHALGAGDRLG